MFLNAHKIKCQCINRQFILFIINLPFLTSIEYDLFVMSNTIRCSASASSSSSSTIILRDYTLEAGDAGIRIGLGLGAC